MSSFKKIVVKDTNYDDRLQKSVSNTLEVQDTANKTTTFGTPNADKRLDLKVVSSEFDQNSENISLIEKIKLTAIPSSFNSFDQFKTFIEQSIASTNLNHLTSIQIPQRTEQNNNSEFIISYKSDNNYYSKAYESFIQDIDEKLIGNYYSERNTEDISKIYNFVTPNKDYFNSIGSEQVVETNDESLSTFKNCIIKNESSVLNEVVKYPFYFNFKFETHYSDNLSNFINSSGLLYDLMDFYINSQPSSNASFDLLATGDFAQVSRNVTTRIFPFSTWLKNKDYSLQNASEIKIIGDQPRPINQIEGNFLKLSLNGIFRNKVKENIRNIEQIYNNKECSNQVLFYKVEKYINNFLGVPTQTFWFPNGNDMINYFDTQVKYGTPYSYRLSAYTLIIGNSYEYTDPVFYDNDGQYLVELTVENFPSSQIVQIPLIDFSMASIQNPPLKPQIAFSTKMSSDNNIKITLSHNIGNKLESFVSLSDKDRVQERLMSLVSNNYNGDNGLFYFNTDEHPVYFEVYRVSSPPKNYQDFVGFKIADAKQFFNNSKKSSSHVSVNDYINSNTDYYYMFRAVNVHGHVSNPSAIYRVSLVQDADDSKIKVDTYEFPKPKLFDNNKKFNSLLQVRPALNQIVFDNDQPALFNEPTAKNQLNNIRLGDAKEQIWGRTFKIRCTSSTTGKKIDFNVTFNIKTVNTEENFD